MWGGGWGGELDSAIHKLDLVEKNDFSLIWSNLELLEDFKSGFTQNTPLLVWGGGNLDLIRDFKSELT